MPVFCRPDKNVRPPDFVRFLAGGYSEDSIDETALNVLMCKLFDFLGISFMALIIMIESLSQNNFLMVYMRMKGPHPNPLPTAGAVP